MLTPNGYVPAVLGAASPGAVSSKVPPERTKTRPLMVPTPALGSTRLQSVRFDAVTPAGVEKPDGKVIVKLAPLTPLPEPYVNVSVLPGEFGISVPGDTVRVLDPPADAAGTPTRPSTTLAAATAAPSSRKR